MRQVLHVDRAGAGLKVVGKLKSRMHVQSLIQDSSSDDREINLCFFRVYGFQNLQHRHSRPWLSAALYSDTLNFWR